MNNKLNNWAVLTNEEMILVKGGNGGETEVDEPRG